MLINCQLFHARTGERETAHFLNTLVLLLGVLLAYPTLGETTHPNPSLPEEMNVAWLYDNQNKVTVHDVMAGLPMTPLYTSTVSLGRREGTVWLQVDVPPPPLIGDQTLEISYPHLREIELYWVREGTLIQVRNSGYAIADNEDIPCRGFCFIVPKAPPATLDLFLAIRSDSPILVPIHFHDRASFQWHTRSSHILLGVFYGSFAVMLFFNLFVYFSTRAREYLFYGAYLASLCVWIASHDGTLRDYVIAHDTWAQDYRFHFLVTLTGVVAGGMFSQSFLNTKQHVPGCDRVLRVLIGLGWGGILWLLLAGETFWQPAVNLLMLLLSATVITSAMLMLHRGIMTARFFLVAWVSVVTGSILWVMTLVGILPYLSGAPFYVHVGCFFETILLSMALGDRINQLQHERNRLQKLAQHRLEQINHTLEISNQFKDEFLSTVSHELRTPMNGIIGSSELLKMTSLSEEQHNHLGNIECASKNMMRLVEDILTYTQIEAGRLALESKPFNFIELLEDACQPFRARAQQKHLAFSCQLTEELPQPVEGDADKLKLLIGHLLDNACKFTDQGGIKISACLVEAAFLPSQIKGNAWQVKDAKWLRISISDTGCGVPGHLQRQVFELFKQADGSLTRKQGGLGIGLALCQRIIHLMGGLLEFESEANRGTHVHLHLPLKTVAEVAPDGRALPRSA